MKDLSNSNDEKLSAEKALTEDLDELSQYSLGDVETLEKSDSNFEHDEEDPEKQVKLLKENHHKINKKILFRSLSFVIYSLIYLIISELPTNKRLIKIKASYTGEYLNYIMIGVYIVTVILFLISIIPLLFPKVKEKVNDINLEKKTKFYEFIDWLSIIPLCVVISTICFSFFFTCASVDGSSMEYTIDDGSIVFVSYLDQVDFSDIVVVNVNGTDNNITFSSSSYDEYYIKRVIGLPGDTLTWMNGVLTINGKVVTEDYLSSETLTNNSYDTRYFNGSFVYIDDNGNLQHTSIIPDGYYFVMGDNRRVSNDSRNVGLIPEKNVVGVVKHVFEKNSLLGGCSR